MLFGDFPIITGLLIIDYYAIISTASNFHGAAPAVCSFPCSRTSSVLVPMPQHQQCAHSHAAAPAVCSFPCRSTSSVLIPMQQHQQCAHSHAAAPAVCSLPHSRTSIGNAQAPAPAECSSLYSSAQSNAAATPASKHTSRCQQQHACKGGGAAIASSPCCNRPALSPLPKYN